MRVISKPRQPSIFSSSCQATKATSLFAYALTEVIRAIREPPSCRSQPVLRHGEDVPVNRPGGHVRGPGSSRRRDDRSEVRIGEFGWENLYAILRIQMPPSPAGG